LRRVRAAIWATGAGTTLKPADTSNARERKGKARDEPDGAGQATLTIH
jgi:hypothetical protein